MFTSRNSERKHPRFCSSSEQILTLSAVQVSSRSPCDQNRVHELNWSGTLTWTTMSDEAEVSEWKLKKKKVTNFRAFSGFLAREEMLGRNTSSFLFLNHVSFIWEKTATQRHSFMRRKGNYLLNIVWSYCAEDECTLTTVVWPQCRTIKTLILLFFSHQSERNKH